MSGCGELRKGKETKKKPVRQPRKIEVVEDAAVTTKTEPKAAKKPATTKAQAESKTKATLPPTVAPEAQPAKATRRTDRHSREVWRQER